MKRFAFSLRRAMILLGILSLCVYFLLRPTLSPDPLWQELWDTVITRGICSVIFLFTLIELESPVLARSKTQKANSRTRFSPRALLYCLPFLAIAVNNFPLLPLFRGEASVTGTASQIAVFGLGCLLIGTFEEFAFRGVIFLGVLRRFGDSPRKIFFSILATSAIFGLIHLANLFSGGSPLGVLMQVGYSFLIGGMCAIALLKTGSIWIPVFLHALYDFGGYLVPKLGQGRIWTGEEIALTAVVAVLVFGYSVYLLTKITPEEVGRCIE